MGSRQPRGAHGAAGDPSPASWHGAVTAGPWAGEPAAPKEVQSQPCSCVAVPRSWGAGCWSWSSARGERRRRRWRGLATQRGQGAAPPQPSCAPVLGRGRRRGPALGGILPSGVCGRRDGAGGSAGASGTSLRAHSISSPRPSCPKPSHPLQGRCPQSRTSRGAGASCPQHPTGAPITPITPPEPAPSGQQRREMSARLTAGSRRRQPPRHVLRTRAQPPGIEAAVLTAGTQHPLLRVCRAWRGGFVPPARPVGVAASPEELGAGGTKGVARGACSRALGRWRSHTRVHKWTRTQTHPCALASPFPDVFCHRCPSKPQCSCPCSRPSRGCCWEVAPAPS